MALQLKRQGITRVRPLLGGLGRWMELEFPVTDVMQGSGQETNPFVAGRSAEGREEPR